MKWLAHYAAVWRGQKARYQRTIGFPFLDADVPVFDQLRDLGARAAQDAAHAVLRAPLFAAAAL